MDGYHNWRIGLFAMWIMLSISTLVTVLVFLVLLLLGI